MKRLRLSERAVMTLRPRRMSSRQSSGSGSRASNALEAAGDGFDGRQRIVQLVAQHAHQALPGLQFLLAQGPG